MENTFSYEQAYKNALERAKKMCATPTDKATMEYIFPELSESEDERIRKWLYDYFSRIGEKNWILNREVTLEQVLAWLEEQKDKNCLACDQHLKGYLAGRKVTEEEKQKESIRKFTVEELLDEYDKGYAQGKLEGVTDGYNKAMKEMEQKELENTSASTMIPSGWAKDPDKCPEYCVRSHCLGCPNYEQKEQNPNIELIQRSWYMEGYHDGKFKQEPKWILKTGEGGPTHELNPRYGQPLAETSETPSNLDALMDSYFENLQVPEHQIIFEDTFRKIAKDFYGYCKDALLEWAKVHIQDFESEFQQGQNYAFQQLIDKLNNF